MAPLVLSPPAAVTTEAGRTVSFSIEVAAVPDACYQWFKNGKPVSGATETVLKIGPVRAGDAASYSVAAANEHGNVTGRPVALTVRWRRAPWG